MSTLILHLAARGLSTESIVLVTDDRLVIEAVAALEAAMLLVKANCGGYFFPPHKLHLTNKIYSHESIPVW